MSAYRRVKRLVVLITGYTILFVGIAMILLPGPAFILIPLGLGILGTELPWAKRFNERALRWIRKRRGKAAAGQPPNGTAR